MLHWREMSFCVQPGRQHMQVSLLTTVFGWMKQVLTTSQTKGRQAPGDKAHHAISAALALANATNIASQ
jgi:hypothetical protein